jgi:hypothetical protein
MLLQVRDECCSALTARTHQEVLWDPQNNALVHAISVFANDVLTDDDVPAAVQVAIMAARSFFFCSCPLVCSV